MGKSRRLRLTTCENSLPSIGNGDILCNMKECAKCKQSLALNHFHNDKTRPDLKYPYCKDCRRKLSGAKKMAHNIIGYYNGHPITFNKRYPYILIRGRRAVRAHRHIIEDRIGRKIGGDESVHHIDGNKQNWAPDNLVLMKDSDHRSAETTAHNHARGRVPVYYKCCVCGKEKKYSSWVKKNDRLSKNYRCWKCYRTSGKCGTGIAELL